MKKESLLFLLLILLAAGCSTNCRRSSLENTQNSLLVFNSVKIALYIDNAVWPDCRKATENKIKECDFEYIIINSEDIRQGILLSCSVLIMPGGRPDLFETNLGQKNFAVIRDYVARGGGYIGICGGAYLAAETNVWRGWAGEPRTFISYRGFMRIFPGTADGPIAAFAPAYRDFYCAVRMDRNHPVTKSLPETIHYIYDHGPELIIPADSDDLQLGQSVRGSNCIITASEYGNGRVFLTSGHPELMNSVECTNLIRNAVIWCSKQEG